MALLRKNFQPYFPDPNAPNNYLCPTDRPYCHPIALGDTIRSQFYQEPCGANLIDDPDFSEYTLGSEELTNGTFTGNANGWVTGAGVLPSNGWSYDSNNIYHTPGTTNEVFQTGLAMAAGWYLVEIDITRVSGSVRVIMGDGAGAATTNYFDETGTHNAVIYYADTGDQTVQIDPNPTDDFDGWINSISVKLIGGQKWDGGAGGWYFSLEGTACHTIGATDLLQETVANYISAGEYYEIQVTTSGVVAGTCDVYIADVNVGTIDSSGVFYYYGTPTVTGVVSFDPSSDFDGCITYVDLRLLRNDYDGNVVNEDGDEYSIGSYFEYYQRYVTLSLLFAELELPYGCYTIEIFDSCLTTGNELLTNGDFATGDYTGWTRNNGAHQYNINGSNQLELIFDPMTGETELVTNGDFSAGSASWTVGAGWTIGTAAAHTPGNTASLTQTIAISPPPVAPTPEQYWAKMLVSGRTAGTVRFKWGNSTSAIFSSNGTFMVPITPGVSGSVDLEIIPSTDFDGTVDDISLIASNTIWSATPFMTNTVNPDIVEGNYKWDFEIIANTDSQINFGGIIIGQAQAIDYENAVNTYSKSITNYVPGAQNMRIQASFRNSNNFVAGTITVDNLSLVRVEPFEATYISECLNFQLEHTNTRMMVGYCDQDGEAGMGFEFTNSGFRLQQRVVVRSIDPVQTKEKSLIRNGNGSARVGYVAKEKYWAMHTEFGSETLHDAVGTIIDCDHFLLGTAEDNGKEYIAEVEDYAPAWLGNGFNKAPVVINLRIKENGQVFNRHI